MSLKGDAWVSGLVQMGPPPWAHNAGFRVPDWFLVPTLHDLKRLASHRDNERAMLFLLGQDEAYDGILFGIYTYWPNLSTAQPNDDGEWVWVNDGLSAWRKIA